MFRILVLNPGSTSTKLAIFEDEKQTAKVSIEMPQDVVQASQKVAEQLDYRVEQVRAFLSENGMKVEDFDMIAARGGMLPPCEGGAYAVNEHMIDVITYAPLAQHASNLACLMADKLSGGKVKCIVYDPLTMDEMDPIAKITGRPEMPIKSVTHALNSRKVARTSAEQHGEKFEENNYIVVHMGGGVSINAYKHGRLVDLLCTTTGPMSPERCGYLPSETLMEMCYSGKYTKDEMRKMLVGKGGFYAYFGTTSAQEVKKMALSGDKKAQDVVAAFNYQVAKGIGQMYAAMGCDVTAIIYTGGMANNVEYVEPSAELVKSMGRIDVMPGEEEMEALAQGAMRVLKGEESAKEFKAVPEKFSSMEEFKAFLKEEKK